MENLALQGTLEVSNEPHLSLIEEKIKNDKLAILEADKKKGKYIKEKVFQLHSKWWEAIESAISSDDKDERRMALIEFNKLQCRILPSQLDMDDAAGLIVNVVKFGSQVADKKEIVDRKEIEDK